MALVVYGTPPAGAAAAVLAYRAFQLGLPALLGAVALARLRDVVERAANPSPSTPLYERRRQAAAALPVAGSRRLASA